MHLCLSFFIWILNFTNCNLNQQPYVAFVVFNHSKSNNENETEHIKVICHQFNIEAETMAAIF